MRNPTLTYLLVNLVSAISCLHLFFFEGIWLFLVILPVNIVAVAWLSIEFDKERKLKRGDVDGKG